MMLTRRGKLRFDDAAAATCRLRGRRHRGVQMKRTPHTRRAGEGDDHPAPAGPRRDWPIRSPTTPPSAFKRRPTRSAEMPPSSIPHEMAILAGTAVLGQIVEHRWSVARRVRSGTDSSPAGMIDTSYQLAPDKTGARHRAPAGGDAPRRKSEPRHAHGVLRGDGGFSCSRPLHPFMLLQMP